MPALPLAGPARFSPGPGSYRGSLLPGDYGLPINGISGEVLINKREEKKKTVET